MSKSQPVYCIHAKKFPRLDQKSFTLSSAGFHDYPIIPPDFVGIFFKVPYAGHWWKADTPHRLPATFFNPD